MRRKIVPDVVYCQKLAKLPGSATVRQAARLMAARGVGSVLIVKGSRLEGIFTERDMVHRVVSSGLDPDRTLLDTVMTKDPHTISPDASPIEALRVMQDGGFRHLPIIDGGRVVAIVSRRDFYGEEKARLDEETRVWERL